MRASPFERDVLPVLVLVACARGVPPVVRALARRRRAWRGPVGERSGLHVIAAVAVVLAVLMSAEGLARRAGLAPI